MKPIASIFINVVKQEIKEPLQLAKLQKLETVILDLFLYCGLEYRLTNWLKQSNFLSNMYQFTINNAIVPVDHSGNIIYNEKVTKGALLTLKQKFKQFFEHHNNFKLFHNEILKYEYNFIDSISNFIQLWKEKSTLYEGKIIFP